MQSGIRNRRRSRRTCRRGTVLVEMVVMTVVISVVATVLLPMLGAVRRANGAARYEQLAMIELENVRTQLEQSRPENRAALEDHLKTVEVGEWFGRRYPTALLTVSVATAAEIPEHEQLVPIRLTLAGSGDTPSQARRTVSVVAWIPVPQLEKQP